MVARQGAVHSGRTRVPDPGGKTDQAEQHDFLTDLNEVVMGLHWAPAERRMITAAADLDAMCVLFDAQDRVLEVIFHGNTRNTEGSVVHTGDSRTGASLWDDERIFVFLGALPKLVSKVAFVVSSASGHPFQDVRGAFCHISDRLSEMAWVRVELTSLVGRTAHVVATLSPGEDGWRMVDEGEAINHRLLADLSLLTKSAKAAPPLRACFQRKQ